MHQEHLLDDPNYIAHRVTMLDTLAGLALKYKTTREVIRRTNRLPNDMVIQRDFIFIPRSANSMNSISSSNDLSENGILRIFIGKTGCGREEARFYLEASKWVINDAMELWHEDMKWSKKQ